MNIGYVSEEQLPAFESLLLPDATEALAQGKYLSMIGLEEDGVACGAIAGGVTEDGDLEILSLYVAPDYRRRGGGRQLVTALLRQAKEALGNAQVLVDFVITEEEHQTLPPFLKAMGFWPLDDGGENIYYVTLRELQGSAFFKDQCGTPGQDILPFQQIQSSELLAAQHRAAKEQVPLPSLPLDSPELDRRVSCAKVWDGKVLAFITFDHSIAGELTLSCAWNGDRSPATMVALLQSASCFAARNYPPETTMIVQAVNSASAQLIRQLLPTAQPVSACYLYSLLNFTEEGGL